MLKNSETLILRITPELNDAIKADAAKHDKTLSLWAREALSEKLEKDVSETRIKDIERYFVRLNDEGQAFLLSCAKVAASSKGMRK